VDLDEDKINETIENSDLAKDGSVLTFMEPRAAMSSLDGSTASIFAEARSMVDWNQRNKACSSSLQNRSHIPNDDLVLSLLWFTSIFLVGRMEAMLHVSASLGRKHRQETLSFWVRSINALEQQSLI
jgi:hypothetical protein